MAELFRATSSPFSGGDVIWLRETNASDIARTEFFGEGVTTAGYVKYWTGTTWVLKPVKYWNGSAWIQKPVKYWNGSAWLLA